MENENKLAEENPNRQYSQTLGDQVNNIEQEARMILPGIQTLFGFQLMVGFNPSFKTYIHGDEQYIHLVSLLLVAVSGLLTMAPAAYHRQANHQISKHFVKISSRFIGLALAPLAIGTCLDVYLVTRIMGDSVILGRVVSAVLFLLYLGIWFVYPQIRGRRVTKLPTHVLPEDKKA
jgi:hypothetical protein